MPGILFRPLAGPIAAARQLFAFLRCLAPFVRWRVFAVVNLFFFVGCVLLWFRSYWRIDGLSIRLADNDSITITSRIGVISIGRYTNFGPVEPRLLTFSSSDAGEYRQRVEMMRQLFDIPTTQPGGRRQFNPDPPFDYSRLERLHRGKLISALSVTFAHWFLVLVAGGPVVLWLRPAVRRYRRSQRGECVQCGYDLRGSPGTCPECGSQRAVSVSGAVTP